MKYYSFFIPVLFFTIASSGQSVGNKVRFTAVDGKQYTGVIKEINGENYKIKYDGHDFESWLQRSQFTLDGPPAPGTTGTNSQSSKFKVGDKVEADDYGTYIPAEILEVGAGKYKVHYTGFGNQWDKWLEENKVRAVGSGEGKTKEKVQKDPEMNGSLPRLNGTAWYLIQQTVDGKTSTPFTFPAYLFLKNGRFEIHWNYPMMGTYTVNGNKVTQVMDGADRLTTTYTMKWNAAEKYLELRSGADVMRLRYNTTTTQ